MSQAEVFIRHREAPTGFQLKTQRELSERADLTLSGAAEATVEVRARTTLDGNSADYYRPDRNIWRVIFILLVVNIFNFLDRMAFAVLLPSVKADLMLSDTQLGLLVGFAFSILYAVCGIPIARWADRGNRSRIITIALAIWSVMTALSGAAHNFWHLLLARIGVGVGEAGCSPPAQSMISDCAPLSQRPAMYAIYNFGLIAGTMLGMALGGWLDELIGWRWTFVVLGLPGLAFALVVRFKLREPARGRFDSVKDETTYSFGQTIRVLWHSRIYRILVLLLAVGGFVNFGLMQWWPSLYARVFGLTLSAVGVYLGVAIGIGSGIGLLIGGLWANKAAQRDVALPLKISAAASLCALPTAIGSLFVPSVLGSMFLVGTTLLLMSIQSGPVIAALYSAVTSGMRATAGSISIFFTSILGMGLGPFCVGLLSDTLTPSFGIDALRYALLLPACLILVLVATLYFAAREARSAFDARGREGVMDARRDRHGAVGS